MTSTRSRATSSRCVPTRTTRAVGRLATSDPSRRAWSHGSSESADLSFSPAPSWGRRIVAALAGLAVRRQAEAEAAATQREAEPPGEIVLERSVPSTRRRELAVALLLIAAAIAFVGF